MVLCVSLIKFLLYHFPFLKNYFWRDLHFDIFEKGVVGEKGVTSQ